MNVPTSTPATLVSTLQATLDRSRNQTVGVVAGFTSDQYGDWFGSSGLANLAANTPVQTRDRFQIGSITKTFVATVVMQLVQEGRLSLDDTLSQRLPATLVGRIPNNEQIQVRQLLNHTSGVFNYADVIFDAATNLFREWTAPELIAFAYDNAYFAPGTSWRYANTNYVLLGEIVAAVTGAPVSQAIRDRILTPLGMSNTFFATDNIPGSVVSGYWDIDNNGSLNDVSFLSLSWAGASGDMISTAPDLTRFSEALFGGQLVTPATLNQMLTFVDTPNSGTFNGYGLGIARLRGVPGEVYGHNGLTLGYRSNLWYSPAEEVSYVDLQNTRVFTNFVRPLFETWREQVALLGTASTPTAPPVFAWGESFGSAIAGPEQQQGYRITRDNAGNVYTIGQFENATTFETVAGTVTLTPPENPGKGDIFITKQDAQGNVLWVKQFGGPQRDLGWDIQVDRQGNLFHTGSFDATADFDPSDNTLNLSVPNFSEASAARRSGYLSKLDANGTVAWAVQIASGLDTPTRIGGNVANQRLGLDAAGNVYLSGYFQSNRRTDFNWLANQGAPGASVLGSDNSGVTNAAFVAKYGPNGEFLWVKQQGGNRNTQANAIAVDAAGNTYTIGTFRGVEDFDPNAGVVNLTSPSITDSDIYISKLDPNGNLVWVRQLGGRGSDEGNAIALDSQGNLYVTGNFTGTDFRFNPSNPSQTYRSVDGRKDIFVTKFTTNGEFVWSRQIDAAENQDALSLTVDRAGNLYYGGEFRGTVDFDPGAGVTPLTSPNAISSFVSKLNARGEFQWAVPLLGNSATLSLSDIAVDATGDTIVGTGYFSSADADLNPGPGLFSPTFTQARDAFTVQLQVPDQLPPQPGFNPGAVVPLTPGFDPIAAAEVGLFSLTNLGTLGGRFSQAFDINESGQIVGWANDAAGNRRPALWQQGRWTDLGTPNAVSGQAQGINNAGEVVGFVDNQSQRSAILWQGTNATNLGNLGAPFAAGYAINDFGAVTGVSRDAVGTDFNPFLWTATTGMTNLRQAPSSFDFAWDINNRGQVAGYSTIASDNQPTVWQGDQAIILSDLGGGFGNAQGINDLGLVVGFSGTSTTNASARAATRWDLAAPDQPINLGTLPGGSRSTALRINNLNQVVGWSRDAAEQTRATLWQNQTVFNLNHLVVNRQDWNLTFAWGINDRSQIVGYGDFQGNNPRAFLLTPLDTSGNDDVYGSASDEALYGGAGNDNLYAGEGNNFLFGGDGNDNLYAGAGNDYLDGGNGNNQLYGGEGQNRLFAGSGDDLIFGGSQQDVISSGSGDDIIYAGEGDNRVDAGTGNDRVYLGSGVDTLVLNAGAGSVTVFGGFDATDKISLGAGLNPADIGLSFENGDTLIRSGNDLLATVKWVQLSHLTI
jgi:D-alanyl-D-alanine carboxypeptidase